MSGWAGFWIGLGLYFAADEIACAIKFLGSVISDGVRYRAMTDGDDDEPEIEVDE